MIGKELIQLSTIGLISKVTTQLLGRHTITCRYGNDLTKSFALKTNTKITIVTTEINLNNKNELAFGNENHNNSVSLKLLLFPK